MIKSYLGLLTFFAVQHQVLSAEGTMDVKHGLHQLSRRSTSAILRSDFLKGSHDVQEMPQFDFDAKVSGPALMNPVVSREPPNRTHRHRPEKSNETSSQTTPLQPTNIVQKITNETAETIETEVLKNKASTSNINDLKSTQTAEENLQLTTHKIQNNGLVTPASSFLRRVNYLDEQERNKPQKWTHCFDLITPRLKGYRDEWKIKEHNHTHADVMRLIQLIRVDVSTHTKEEIESILFQISNIPLRLFQWDYTAITAVLNNLITEPTHNFRTLKSGIKALFSKWHLDTTMIHTFLRQSRIFRPPCIDTSPGVMGSTKKSRGLQYTKADNKVRKPRSKDKTTPCDSHEVDLKVDN